MSGAASQFLQRTHSQRKLFLLPVVRTFIAVVFRNVCCNALAALLASVNNRGKGCAAIRFSIVICRRHPCAFSSKSVFSNLARRDHGMPMTTVASSLEQRRSA